MIIVVMGVSGSGKTTVGSTLASALKIPFHDADNFHPQSNIVKMKQGIPLQDIDRESWLKTLTNNLAQWEADKGAVLACSALKEIYRTVLQSGVNNDVTWIYLYGRSELIKERTAGRRGPASSSAPAKCAARGTSSLDRNWAAWPFSGR